MSEQLQIPETGNLFEGKRVESKKVSRNIRTVIFVLEVIFVFGLLIWWLSSSSVRQNKSLWVVFFYCFPAEFLIATVPHEPLIFYFAKFYTPATIALVSIGGTILTEILNYSAFQYVADLRVFNRMHQGKAVKKTVSLFRKAPFLALWVAGFTPIPFYPFRFLVVLARYPLSLYLLAVFTSRAPRFYLLAMAARAIKLPDYFLILLFIVLIVVTNISLLTKLRNKLRRRRASAL